MMLKDTTMLLNEFDQPVGESLKNWTPAKAPEKINLVGRYCILEPLNSAKHAQTLFEFFSSDNSNWTYLPYGPFDNVDDFYRWLTEMTKANDPFLYAIVDCKTNIPIGMAGYLRITPELGTIEIGHVHFSNKLKKTSIATEAMYLLMHNAFENLGYRRYEWKCDSLNQPSRNTAERLGFQFEGIFRQDRVYKNRNRDTAWFSIIDGEWPRLKNRFEKWLNPSNFDHNSKQIQRLQEIV